MNFVARILLCVALAAATAACGNKIGDSCAVSTDCSADGNRTCDTEQTSPGGYCTIPGCDETSCPSEAACVQFFSIINVDKTCTKPSDCTIDEICTVGGYCAARDSELRFCMLTCDSASDCRDGYECRDLDRMGAHGGQPVPKDGQPKEQWPSFCAAALPCTADAQCDLGDHCDLGESRCVH
jgi:hypothetical protein